MFPSPLSQDTGDLTKRIMAVWTKPGNADFSVRTRANQITDGLSRTFMLTEIAGRPEHHRKGERVHVGEPLASAWADPSTSFAISSDDSRSCIMQCDNDGEIYSFHPSGANFLFADGHVEFLQEDVDPKLVLELMTPDRGDNHR